MRRRGASITWIRQTAERLHRPGQRGTKTLLRLLDGTLFEGRVPDSWFEELLARCLDHPGIPPLVPQFVVRGPNGEHLGRVDLAIPELRLGIEAHSRRHHFGPGARSADEARDLRLAAVDWDLLYLGWHATKHPTEVADLVAEVVAARRRHV